MESFEVLRKTFKKFGDKNVAAALKLSVGTINKWFRARGNKGTGRINPLDRVAQLVALPGGEALLVWLCALVGGRFVPAAQVPPLRPEERLPACHRLVVELGELVAGMGKLLPTGRLTAAERDALRPLFAQLQTDMERLLTEGDKRWKLGHSPNSQLPTPVSHLPDARESGGSHSQPGGSRCRFRLADHRCGFPHAARN
ncbi:MAG: hypothetical protein WCF18_05720, partial [Chthoniobacteraceae bacterium]